MAVLTLLARYIRPIAATIEPVEMPDTTRQQRWIHRSNNGVLVALVPTSQDDTALLVHLGLLDPNGIEDRRQIARAIVKLMLTLRKM